MSPSLLTLLLSILILLIMAGTFLFFYLSSLRQHVRNSGSLLLEKLNLRLDKIPALLEAVKLTVPKERLFLQNIIELRSNDRALQSMNEEKFKKEKAVSEELEKLLSLEKKFPELKKNTNFLILKSEYKNFQTEIEQALDDYNKKAQGYNKFIQLIPLRLFTFLLGFKIIPLSKI